MKEANVDTILLWTYLPQSAAIIKQRIKMGWDVPLISNNTTGVPPLFALTGEAADGYMLVTPYAPATWIFRGSSASRRSTRSTAIRPRPWTIPSTRTFFTWPGGDTLRPWHKGSARAGRDLNPETLVNGLESVHNFDMGGLCPNITFGPKQHVSSFSSLILKADAKAKRFVIIDSIKSPKTPQN